MREGRRERLGPFDCEFFAVNHSIPDALAVGVRTDAGTVVHTGDFKMDQLPLDGRITDLRGLARLADEGIDLAMVDSTNAEVPGFVPAEVDIAPVLDRVFASGPRAGSSSPASPRMCTASSRSSTPPPRTAARPPSSVAPWSATWGWHGTSATSTIRPGLVVRSDDLAALPDDEVVLICTGSQGEPMAALSRIANGDHAITVGPGDTVILASSLIPGNENPVNRVINGLTRWGADVVHKGNALVHVSGHASAGELLFLYNLLTPRNVMPVHGEPRHLRANAALAVRTGIRRPIGS